MMIKKAVLIVLSVLFVVSSTACRLLTQSTDPGNDMGFVFVDVDTPTPAPEAEASATAAPVVVYSTVPAPVTEPAETEPVETEPVETEPVETEPAETEPATAAPTPTPAPPTGTPEPVFVTAAPVTAAPTQAPVVVTNAPVSPSGKIIRGAYTGTSSTYTGYEPLPLSDFNNPPMENVDNLSTACIDHCTGNPTNGQVHDVVVTIQRGFDERGADAVCYDDKTTEKVLYLTFDLGVENGYTNMILDTLREKNVKTTFFCTLPEIKAHPEIMTRIIHEGHILGNHSCTHPDFSSLSHSRMYQEIKGFDDYLRTHYGYSASYFRYPMGKHSIDSTDFLNRMGYTCVFWSIAWVDFNEPKGADVAYQTVIGKLHPGAIILLHALSQDNAYALADIIDTARSMGYEFRTLPELRR